MWFRRKAPTRRLYRLLLCVDGEPVADCTREVVGHDELAAAADGLAERYVSEMAMAAVPSGLRVMVLDAEDRFVLHHDPCGGGVSRGAGAAPP